MNVPPDSVMAIPLMTAAALLALARSLQTSLTTAQAAQVSASEAQAANTRGRRRNDAEPEAAVPVSIPGNIPSCMKRLDGACATLSLARRSAASEGAGRAPSSVRQSVTGRYRKAWSAVTGQLSVWNKAGVISELPEASRASLTRVFGEELRAPDLSGTAAAAWVKGADTLDHVKSEGVEALFSSLGGARVLANLTRTHAEIGASLGITVAVSSSTPASISVRDALAAARSVMSEYVIKVHAMIDPEVPGSEAVASSLLAPFGELSKRARPVKKATKTAPVTPPVTRREVADPANDAAPLRPTGTD